MLTEFCRILLFGLCIYAIVPWVMLYIDAKRKGKEILRKRRKELEKEMNKFGWKSTDPEWIALRERQPGDPEWIAFRERYHLSDYNLCDYGLSWMQVLDLALQRR